MERFLRFMESHFLPIASRVGRQRHLVAIRDSFVFVMPLILAGSFAVLLNNTLLKWLPFLEFLRPINDSVWWGSLAIMTLLVVFAAAYNLARHYQSDGLAAGLVAVGAFISVIPQQSTEEIGSFIGSEYLSTTGLFTGILISLISAEIFVRLMKRDLTIKLPDNVPPAVGRSFAAILPGIITLYVVGAGSSVVYGVTGESVYSLISSTLQQPLQAMSQGILSAIAMAVIINLLWFFGLHGSAVVDPVYQSLYLTAIEENARAVQMGGEAVNIINKSFFDAFVHLGGAGATLGLIIAIFVLARKRNEYREVAKLGVLPALFQINEPILFGLPVVLNPLLFIPFLLTPAVLTLTAYLATLSGIVPIAFVLIPWSTPPVVGGFLATGGSVAGALLALVNLLISVLIYLPFIVLAEKQMERQAAGEAKEAIVGTGDGAEEDVAVGHGTGAR